MTSRSDLKPLEDRGPLRVMFLVTSLPVGGAETLLLNLVRRMDPDHFAPSICCLKELGPLGEELATETRVYSRLIHGKYDLGVVRRLARLLRRQRVDAVVTVGAGDKMFWGRIAARLAGVPVICSALHSTGWPDTIGRLNRLWFLTRWTDAFIGVAEPHARHLVEVEHFPAEKVRVIPNGVDVQRFRPSTVGARVRSTLGIDPQAPVVAIVAALRPEKNHQQFLRVAAEVRKRLPAARFLIVGDGPQRPMMEQLADELGLNESVLFLGTRDDIPDLLAASNVFVLTSKMEANPVSILEAMASGKPVVAPRVGSIGESVSDGVTGYLTTPGDDDEFVERVTELLSDHPLAERLGAAGREAVCARWSLEAMVTGYEDLLKSVYNQKCDRRRIIRPAATAEALRQRTR